MEKTTVPTLEDIEQTYERIKDYIHKTPILQSEIINNMAGCEIFFKCENFQKGGAFKIRGATNAILNLTEEQKRKGVASHSSGNHAGAVARAAKIFGLKSYLVMPKNSPTIKKDYVLSLGGNVIDSDATIESREAALEKIIQETGAFFIHPFNDYRVIEGQATVSYEVFKELDNIDYLLCPISGGGLFSGQCLTTKFMSPNTKLIGVEPYLAGDAYLSLKQGEIHKQLPPLTIADGLRMVLGDKTFQIISDNCDEILLVTEQQIVDATNLVWKIMKILIEPSSATVLAAVLNNKEKFKGKRVVLVISGGNVDVSMPVKPLHTDKEQELIKDVFSKY